MASRRTAAEIADEKIRKALMDNDRLSDLHNYRVDRYNFTIYVGGDPAWEDYAEKGSEPGVEYRMADRFCINLNLLSRLNPKKPILVEVASCGGDFTEGMQMFSAILFCPNPITVMATKWARSMTSIIPLAADRFVLRPPAKYMIHHGTYAWDGDAGEQADTEYRQLIEDRKMMFDIYTARLREQGKWTRRSPEAIRKMLQAKMRQNIDFWLPGQEAVAWGFADGMYTGDWKNLRAQTVNTARRERMVSALQGVVK